MYDGKKPSGVHTDGEGKVNAALFKPTILNLFPNILWVTFKCTITSTFVSFCILCFSLIIYGKLIL